MTLLIWSGSKGPRDGPAQVGREVPSWDSACFC